MGNETEEQHPAYGLMSIHRVTGNPGTLFGSPLDYHHGFIEIHVAKGTVITRNATGEQRYFGASRGDKIVVRMSNNQFAEMITTLNIGVGIPVTITSFDGKPVEEIPQDRDTPLDTLRDSLETELSNKTRTLREAESRLDEILDKKGALNKKDRLEIKTLYKNILQNFESNTSFAVTLYKETLAKVTTEAKANVDSFVASSLTALGLDALKKKFTSSTVLSSLSARSKKEVLDALPEK